MYERAAEKGFFFALGYVLYLMTYWRYSFPRFKRRVAVLVIRCPACSAALSPIIGYGI